MLEVLNAGASARHAKVAIFDFDGTVSLVRSGWVHVMVPMMVDGLRELNSGESDAELTRIVEEYVGQLTGKETIYQMIQYAAELEKRGGKALPPLDYKHEYLRRLWEVIKDRVADLQNGAAPEKYMVPGSRALLEALKARGLKIYLASGTDEVDVRREAGLLDLARYFDGGIFGASDDMASFSKGMLVKRLVEQAGYSGEELLVFGDGYVEIDVVKQAGGIAVGLATDEPECLKIDAWKRQRLAGVGADFMLPNFLGCESWLPVLFATE
ncbi:MAG: HAD family hydrolase [Bryobacteraceae bacterium]|nr:HAD family hydrolase [Bryobacteraceae bacterium]